MMLYFKRLAKKGLLVSLLILGAVALAGCPAKKGPAASFSATPTTGSLPLAVVFTDTSDAGSTAITRWAWDFGDGVSATEQHPAHTFANAGTYTVSLTVTTDAGNDTETMTDYIVVEKAEPAITAWPSASAITSGQTLASSTLTGGTTSVAGQFAFDAPDTAPDIGAYTAAVTFTPSDTGNYLNVSGTVDVVVNKITPTVSEWPTASTITHGQPLSASTLTGGTASVPGAFAFSMPLTVPDAGACSANVTFTPSDTANYLTVSGTVQVVVRSVFRVRINGSGDGSSWHDALGSIQEAVTAGAAAAPAEVWVADGAYTAATDPVVTMESNVDIYGGFAGTEQSRGQRDWKSNITTIDGQGERRCVVGANNAILDGFVIRNGTAEYGGGMYIAGASPTVNNCSFNGNTATLGGGGMTCDAGAESVISNCIFSGNTSADGGGLCNWFGYAKLIDCTFTGNSSSVRGGGVFNFSCSPTITRVSFIGNTAAQGGGAVHNMISSSPAITNCTFIANTANSSGGAIFNSDHSSPAVKNCTFYLNTAAENGGAVCNELACSPTMMNCILWDDAAASSGNEIFNVADAEFPSAPMITSSCIDGGYAGAGNTALNPLLIGTIGSNGRIRPASPCINTGSADGAPLFDIRGVARPQDEQVDMGAYELDDSDGDNISDKWEQDEFGGLAAANRISDADDDTLLDLDESLYGSDPFDTDSDGDDMSDAAEAAINGDPTTAPTVYFIDGGNTSGVEDGRSWATACTSIQAAIDAVPSVFQADLWVADGIYTAGSGDNVVVLRPGIRLFGGFDGTETDRAQRDWAANLAIISGEDVRRCVLGANGAAIDGFTLRDGFAETGAGMQNTGASPIVANCTFNQNEADWRGGGMFNNAFSAPTVINCTFSPNYSNSGGGMYNDSSSPIVEGCTFTENGAGFMAGGAGMYNTNQSSPTIKNSTFVRNSAYFGGAMVNSTSSPTLINCCVLDNSAKEGAGIYNNESSPMLINCTFSKNGGYEGASMFNSYESSPELINCILWGDLSSEGGNIYNEPTLPSNPVVTYSCVEGGHAGTGNISTDPMFVDAAADNFQLQPTSPCINTATVTGAPDTDILGVDRPQGSGFDMGAYEYAGR